MIIVRIWHKQNFFDWDNKQYWVLEDEVRFPNMRDSHDFVTRCIEHDIAHGNKSKYKYDEVRL